MSNLENLKESITFLARSNPELARSILKLDVQKVASNFEFQNTEKNEINLFYKKKFTPYFFHSEKGAVCESTNLIQEKGIYGEIIYIFGAGLGYSYLTLKKWLNKNPQMHLVFIEPLLGVLFHLFQTEIGKQIVQHPRVHIYHFTSKKDLTALIERLGVDLAPLKPQVLALPYYEKKYSKTIHFFKHHIERIQENLAVIIQETNDSKEDFFRNFTLAIQNMNHNYNGSMFGQLFKDIPCIIVGAGPSLKKNFSLLKKLKDKALIFAGSSGISSLTQMGLDPHLGTYYDPYQRLYSRFKTNTAFELPLFYAPKTYFEVVKKIHGPKFYLKGSSMTPFVNWMEDNLGFTGPQIPELISVTTCNTSLAVLMGCNPIIYVGCDLAYTDDKSYSEGIVKDPTKNKKKTEKNNLKSNYNEDLDSTDIYGNPIRTRQGWTLESQMLYEQSIAAPHVTFLNCTEGGLGMGGITNISLQKATDCFLKRDYPIEEMLHSLTLPHKIEQKNLSKVATSHLKTFDQSLNRCSKIYEKTFHQIKKLSFENKKGNLKEMSIDFLDEAMSHLGHEIAYQYLLKRYHQIIDIPMIKNRYLSNEFSSDAPTTLFNEVKLYDMFNRFKEYKSVCDRLRVILKYSLKNNKEDPWQ